jgi:hypothetical protein
MPRNDLYNNRPIIPPMKDTVNSEIIVTLRRTLFIRLPKEN